MSDVNAPSLPFTPEDPPSVIARIREGIEKSINACVDEHTRGVREHYERVCGNPDSVQDRLILSYPEDYNHFTLYYYDRAGNLVRTVAPRGVTSDDTSRLEHPAQTYMNQYAYNSLGQPNWVRTPDGDTARVWYDQWGRPASPSRGNVPACSRVPIATRNLKL